LAEVWGEGEMEGTFRHFFFHNLTSVNDRNEHLLTGQAFIGINKANQIAHAIDQILSSLQTDVNSSTVVWEQLCGQKGRTCS
jgi:hypothetical protein